MPRHQLVTVFVVCLALPALAAEAGEVRLVGKDLSTWRDKVPTSIGEQLPSPSSVWASASFRLD